MITSVDEGLIDNKMNKGNLLTKITCWEFFQSPLLIRTIEEMINSATNILLLQTSLAIKHNFIAIN